MLYFRMLLFMEYLMITSTQEKTSLNYFPDSKPTDLFKVEDDHMRSYRRAVESTVNARALA